MSDHGPPPDVSSSEWGEWADGVLEGTEFDTELGKRVGRDARRVTAGDLSPEEFQERYHEDLLEEFETDRRPTAPTPGSPDPGCGDGRCGASDGTDDASRRTVLKAAGAAGLVAVGLSAVNYSTAAVADDDGDDGPDKQAGMVIDTERCIACMQCMQACHEENNTADGSLWSYVFRYEQNDYTDQEYYLSRPCQHCADAPCVNACPTASRFKREEDGIVLTDYDVCTGCRYCEVSCPYGVNYLQWADSQGSFDYGREVDGRTVAGDPPQGVMGKCTFCIHRQVSGDDELEGTTACEDVCPVDAIHFGDLEDPDSAPRQHLAEKPEASKFRLLEDANTQPNVIYIGNEPEMKHPKPVDGPTTVEDAGLTMERPGRSVRDDGGDEDGD